MTTFNDSVSPYNNLYDIKNRWSKVEFAPSRPLFQSELNELQSISNDQIAMLGNSVFKEGAVITGMGLVPQGTVTPTDPDTIVGNPNLLTYATISSYNSRIDTSFYKITGRIGVTSTASLATSYPGIQLSVSGVSGGTATLSFSIKRDSGTLYKLAGIFDKSLTVSDYSIDGNTITTGFDDVTTSTLVTVDNKQINLSDGNSHKVTVTFEGLTSGTYPITLEANPGYSALNEGQVNFTLDNIKIEEGDTATAWKLAEVDKDLSTDTDRTKIYRVLEGYVYINGMVRRFEQQDINITGVGNETIGININEDIVTSDDDNRLLDSTSGAVSQWKRGSDRLHYTLSLAYNDPNSTTLYKLSNGSLSTDTTDSTASSLSDLLARRTNDQSGSYRVSGFDMSSKADTQDSSMVDIVIDDGNAYVLGYQVKTGVPTVLKVPKSVGTADAPDEVFIYSESRPDNGKLSNQPVKSVNQVSGNVQVTDEPINRGATISVEDTLANPAYEIDKVYAKGDGSSTTTYVQGTDFTMDSQGKIKWGATESAKAPAAGTTYYVSYKYQAIFKNGTDYQLDIAGDEERQVTTVTFLGMNGLKPVEGSQVHVSYTYFLARIDVVTVDKTGKFGVVKGQPDKLSSAMPPLQVDPLTLQLGYITVFPNSEKAITQLSTVTRLPFSSLQELSNRVSSLEYNSSISAARNSATTNQNPLNLQGAIYDDFTGVANGDIGNEEFTASYLFSDGAITVPTKASTGIKPDVLEVASSLHKFSHTVTTPFTETPMVSQLLATGVVNVNKYQVFNVMGTLEITPEIDTWTEDNTSTVYVNGTATTLRFGRWWAYGTWTDSNGNLTGKDHYTGQDAYTEMQGITTDSGRDLLHASFGNWASTISGSQERSLGTQTVDSAIEYIRQREVTFSAKNLLPFTDNMKMTFDGQAVDITPADGYASGTDKGSIKIDGAGTAKGSFTIPEGVRTGVREVKLSGTNGSAITTYTAQGTMHTATTTIERRHVTVNFYDPLAQSFAVTQDGILTSLNLWFNSKPSSDDIANTSHRSDVVVQLREMGDQGYPSRTIVSETTLTPDQINTSTDASVVTNVPLADPVSVKAGESYALVVISDSDKYNMYVSTTGQSRIGGTEAAVGQAYVEGTLFTSAGSQTWTADQNSDLKFEVNMGKFSDTGTVDFDTIYPGKEVYTDGLGNPILDKDGKEITMTIDQLVLLADSLTPQNTGIDWQIKIVTTDQPDNVTVNDVDWQPLNVASEIELIKAAREIKFRAIFKASSTLSPILALDSLSLAVFLTETSGTYISKNYDMSATPFNHVRLQYDGYTPGSSTIKPYYSTDAGKTWKEFTNARTKTVSLDRHFTRYYYDLQLYDLAGGDHTVASNFKVKLDMSAQSSFQRPQIKAMNASVTKQDGYDSGTDDYQKP